MGIDLVWIGILLAINLQTSFLTPPFGFALFYLKGVAPPQVTTEKIYQGISVKSIVKIIKPVFPDSVCSHCVSVTPITVLA